MRIRTSFEKEIKRINTNFELKGKIKKIKLTNESKINKKIKRIRIKFI
jgi:hypothetical protein